MVEDWVKMESYGIIERIFISVKGGRASLLYYFQFKIKNHSNMFGIVCDPSSGSIELYLTEIRCGSLMFVV